MPDNDMKIIIADDDSTTARQHDSTTCGVTSETHVV